MQEPKYHQGDRLRISSDVELLKSLSGTRCRHAGKAVVIKQPLSGVHAFWGQLYAVKLDDQYGPLDYIDDVWPESMLIPRHTEKVTSAQVASLLHSALT